jgi:hypothetical protein
MTNIVAHVKSVETKTSKAGKQFYVLTDGNGTDYTTFQAGIAEAARGYVGWRALIEYSEKQKGEYLNRYLDGIQPAPDGAETTSPPPTTSNGDSVAPTAGVDWDAKERRDFRSRAMAQAISAMTHTIPSAATPKDAYEKVTPLADAIYRWVVGDFANPPVDLSAHDESIPFD